MVKKNFKKINKLAMNKVNAFLPLGVYWTCLYSQKRGKNKTTLSFLILKVRHVLKKIQGVLFEAHHRDEWMKF